MTRSLPLTTRRTALAAGSLAAAAVGLAACSSGGDSGSSDGGGTSIDLEERGPITLARGKDTTGALADFLNRWNDDHPDEQVTLIELPESADDQRSQFISNAQAKSDSYTVLGLDVVWTAEFAANQWVVALPEDKFDLDALIPATVTTGTYFDKLYAVPFTTNAQLLFSRKDLLEEAGYDQPPATFEEMWEIVAKVKERHPEINGFGSQYAKYEGLTCQLTDVVASAGGEIFDAEGAPHADSDEATTALQTLRDGFDQGHIPQEALTYKEEESRQAFQDGKLIFLQNWPYVWDHFQNDDGSSQVVDKVQVSLVPAVAGEGTSTIGGANYAISAFAKNKGTAVDFIAFMTALEQQKAWMIETATPTATAAVYEDAEVAKTFAFIDALKGAIDKGVSRPQVVKYGDVTQAIQEAAYSCISGEAEAADALAQLQEQLTGLVEG